MFRQFWADLMTPSRFVDDPWSEGADQITHMAQGAVATALFCFSWILATGELPVRELAFFVLVGFYAVVIEWRGQGWEPGDSWADTFFFGSGVAACLLSFLEVDTSGWVSDLRLDWGALFTVLGVSIIVLTGRLIPRIKRKYGGENV